MNNTDKHEDILIFLEDNISKMDKLKVASRSKYKEYDKCYMSYLTAESLDDDDRMELYGEQTEECYAALRTKLKKAIKDNPDLLHNDLVAEYAELMDVD